MRRPTEAEKFLYQFATSKDSPNCWIVPWRFWFGNFCGFTFFNVIFLKPNAPIEVTVHEMVHVKQFYEKPFTFHARYLWQLMRNGYRNNYYELEACRHETVAAMKRILGKNQ